MSKIVYNCEKCGQQLAAHTEHVGRRARCTACEHVQVIATLHSAPTAPLVAPEPPRSYRDDPAPTEVESPLPDVIPYDEATIDESPRPRTRRERSIAKPKGRRFPWHRVVAAAIVVMLLSGIGMGVWWWLTSGTDEDLNLVPANAGGFISVQPVEILDSYWAGRLRRKIGRSDFDDGVDHLVGQLQIGMDLDPMHLERVTVFFDSVEDIENGWRPEVLTVIVKTTRNYDPEDLLSSFEENLNKKQKTEEVKHEGKSYYVTRDERALYFHNQTIFVCGPEQGVRSSIEAAQAKDDNGPLKEAKRVASQSSSHLTFAENGAKNRGLAKSLRPGVFDRDVRAALERLDELEADKETGLESGYVVVTLGSDVSVKIEATFKDEDTAKDVVDVVEELRDALSAAIDEEGGGRRLRRLVREVEDAVDNADVDRSGKTVRIGVKLEKSLLEEYLDLYMR